MSPPVSHDFTWQSGVLGRAPQVPGGLDHLRTQSGPGVLVLDSGFPDVSLQAQSLLSRSATRAAKRPEAWDRCVPEGLERLRRAFASDLGPTFSAADVVITPGAQAAIDSIFRSFARPGDSILMEEPSYPGAIAAATFAGLNVVPIPTDGNGMRTDYIAAAVERTGARLVFVQTRHANPTGTCLSVERRVELLEVAQRFGMFIIEDDWVRGIDLDGPTLPPLVQQDEHGHVLHLRSVSKISAPGMRIGAIVAKGPAVARLRAVRTIADFFASPLLQVTLCEVFEDRSWERHLVHLRTELRMRRDALVNALTEYAPGLTFNVPNGGVVLWARLPAGVDEASFVGDCRSRGVAVGAGRDYWLSEPPSGFVRLSFASSDVPGLVEAAQRIGAALKDPTSNPHLSNR